MNDTPRVDANLVDACDIADRFTSFALPDGTKYVSANCARQLERELADLAEFKARHTACEFIGAVAAQQEALKNTLAAVRAKMQRQRRELRRLNIQIKNVWPMMLYGMKSAEASRVRVAMIDKFGIVAVREAMDAYDERENNNAMQTVNSERR